MRQSSVVLTISIAWGLFGGLTSPAATVTTIEDEILKGDLVSIKDERLTLASEGGGDQTRVVALNDLISIAYGTPAENHNEATAKKYKNDLGDWSVALRPVGQLSGKMIAWNASNLVFGVAGLKDETLLQVPVAAVRKLWRKDAAEPADAEAASEHADRVFVKTTSDKLQQVSGKAGGVEADSLLFHHRGQDRKILAEMVVAAVLGRGDPEGGREERFYQTVHFGGEQVFPGHWAAITNGVLQFTSLWGQTFELHTNDVQRIDIRNGKLQYLSARRPERVEQMPFFDRVIPFQVDRSLEHEPIKLGDTVYEHGISMHSRSVLTYQLGAQFSRFHSKVGFQQSAALEGNVALRVLGDGKVLFEIEDYGHCDPAKDLDLDVHGVNTLSLEVDFGKGQDVGDHIVWANARLLLNDSAE